MLGGERLRNQIPILNFWIFIKSERRSDSHPLYSRESGTAAAPSGVGGFEN